MDLHLRDDEQPDTPRAKPRPTDLGLDFAYAPSDDGTDENLLVLLHGLGDTHRPFAALARSLRLPHTATLALRAPDPIPYLYEEAYQWYPAFDALGAPLPAPDPSRALDVLARALARLTAPGAWPPARVHLLGFGQGASAAAELAARARPPLASAVLVGGTLLSFPAAPAPAPTAVLLFRRPGDPAIGEPARALAALRRAFAVVVDVARPGAGMPASRAEWEPVMRFWSERLARRGGGGLYEVMSGTAGA